MKKTLFLLMTFLIFAGTLEASLSVSSPKEKPSEKCLELKATFKNAANDWEKAYAIFFKAYTDRDNILGTYPESIINALDKTHVAYYESRAAFEKNCEGNTF